VKCRFVASAPGTMYSCKDLPQYNKRSGLLQTVFSFLAENYIGQKVVNLIKFVSSSEHLIGSRFDNVVVQLEVDYCAELCRITKA
jgi:hypothetical protein